MIREQLREEFACITDRRSGRQAKIAAADDQPSEQQLVRRLNFDQAIYGIGRVPRSVIDEFYADASTNRAPCVQDDLFRGL